MSRGRAGLLAVVVAGAGVAFVAVWPPWSSGGGLRWAEAPQVYHVPGVSTDRVLAGQVVNASGSPIEVDARRIVVIDGRGRRLDTAARFLATFAHPLYAPLQFHTVGDAFQLQRLGVYVRIEPGQKLPLTVSWRAGPSGAPASTIDLGVGFLPLPA